VEHLQHFGLTQDPFSNEPDLRFYFESASHRDAQRRVDRSLRQQKGLTLLTGDGGMGKTLLVRRVLDTLEEEIFEAVLLVMLPGAADATGILQRFARQLGADEPATDRAGLLAQIYEQLAIVREDGRHAVLMIDDAQIMAPEVLSELGGLLNLEYEDRRLLSMLLVGLPELDDRVLNDASLAPRVDVRVRLQPLQLEDAGCYMAHRLAAARGAETLISPEVLETLQKFARGRPRLLNTLADNALFEGYLAGRSEIESNDVERAASDLGIGPDPGSTFSEFSMPDVEGPPHQRADFIQPVGDSLMMDLVEDEGVAEAAAAPLIEEPDEPEEEEFAGDLTMPSVATAKSVEPLSAGEGLDLDAAMSEILGDLTDSADDESAEDVAEEAGVFELEEAAVLADAATALEPEPALAEAESVLAEAELVPEAIAEIDELEDAFVELIEE